MRHKAAYASTHTNLSQQSSVLEHVASQQGRDGCNKLLVLALLLRDARGLHTSSAGSRFVLILRVAGGVREGSCLVSVLTMYLGGTVSMLMMHGEGHEVD